MSTKMWKYSSLTARAWISFLPTDYDCMLFLDDFNEETWESRNLELADLNMSMNGFNFFSLNV